MKTNKLIYNAGQSKVIQAGKLKMKTKTIWLFLSILPIFFSTTAIFSQEVKIAVAEITGNIKVYKYPLVISQTQKKDIEYIVIKASNGDIKTVFNACDVCYNAHKGYSQSGSELRCNNCGNRFKIDALGSNNTGGTCNPGYLPHSIVGENVVIKVSELAKGEYFFLATMISAIEEDFNSKSADSFKIIYLNDDIILKTSIDKPRNISIITINGQLVSSFSSAGHDYLLPVSNFAAGLYLLIIQEDGVSLSKYFYKY